MIMSMLLKNYNLYKNYVSLKCYSNSQSRGGRYGKNIYYYFRNITISQFFVMLILLLCLSSAAKIISLLQKQILSRLQNMKRYWWILRPKWGKIKICHYFIFVIKNNKYIHITNTHNIKIKHYID